MIRVKIDDVMDAMRQGEIQMVSEDFNEWIESLKNNDLKRDKKRNPYFVKVTS